MEGKTVVITGANAGIGYETTKGLAAQGAKVVMVCRNHDRGEEARKRIVRDTGNNDIDLMICDMSDQNSIREFSKTFLDKYDKLNVLINNAGVSLSSWKASPQGIEMQYAVNHLGPFLLTHLLLDRIIESGPSRIINVNSDQHMNGKIDFNSITQSNGLKYYIFTAYAQSKLANILFSNELARRLKDRNVTVNSLNPGTIKTDFGEKHTGVIYKVVWNVAKQFMSRPEVGAQTSIYLASSDEVADKTGRYFENCEEKKSAPLSHDADLAKKIWESSEALTGLRVPYFN